MTKPAVSTISNRKRAKLEAQAQAAYKSLIAMDESAQARAELEAAGVSSQRIEALYPESQFATLTPALLEHIETLSGKKLAAASAPCQKVMDRFLETNPAKLYDRLYAGLEMGDQPDQPSRDLLIHAIFARMKPDDFQLSPASPRKLVYDFEANSIVTALWWGWWGMGNRQLLESDEQRKISAELMLVAASALELVRR